MTRGRTIGTMTQVERLQTDGILRTGSRRTGFRYVYARDGRSARGERHRIAALRLPPAWRDVAIDRSAGARVQAVGRDAAGRWQYVYHASHVCARERRKFARLLRFGAALPRLRRAVASDLRARDLTRDKVLATIARILACAFIRPGSEVYAAENGTYGIATLRRKHVRVIGDTVHFDFAAKSNQRQQRALRDRSVARVVRPLLKLPGYEVFKYVNGRGEVVDIRRADINEYVKRHMGDGFSAKDFRTWAGTLICARALARSGRAADEQRGRRKAIMSAIKETARQLGNTPAVCRSSYVSPGLLGAYGQGRVIDRSFATVEELTARRMHGLHASERALLRLLKRS